MSETQVLPWYLRNYTQQFAARDEYRLLSKMEAVLGQQMIDRNSHRDTTHIHPSEMSKGDWCPRATYYRITEAEVSDPESFSMRRMNIFAEGHYIHEKWQEWMWKAGGLVGVFQCNRCEHRWWEKSPTRCPVCPSVDLAYREVPLRTDEYLMMGHADGEWHDDKGRALIELKSIGLGTIRWDAPALHDAFVKGDLSLDELWKRIKRPLTPHRKQINLYLFMAGVQDAIVIYEWKPTQEVKEFHLTYDEALVKPLLAGATSIVDALEDGIAPPRPEVAHKGGGFCKLCPFKTSCWKAKW